MKKLFLIIFIFATCGNLYGQTSNSFTLKGLLIDQETAKPVPYASILIVNKDKGIASSIKGEFEFQVTPGDTLKISFIGYADYELIIDESMRSSKEKLMIQMTTQAFELGTFEVIQLSDDFYLKRPVLDTMELSFPSSFWKMPIQGVPSGYVPPPDDYQTIPIASIPIFQELDKNPKQARIIRKMKEAKSFQATRKLEREKHFNKDLVKKVTRIDDRVIDEFMEFCRFLDGEIIGKSEFEITQKIIQKYEAFLKR